MRKKERDDLDRDEQSVMRDGKAWMRYDYRIASCGKPDDPINGWLIC